MFLSVLQAFAAIGFICVFEEVQNFYSRFDSISDAIIFTIVNLFVGLFFLFCAFMLCGVGAGLLSAPGGSSPYSEAESERGYNSFGF